jgi:hypothetical protein
MRRAKRRVRRSSSVIGDARLPARRSAFSRKRAREMTGSECLFEEARISLALEAHEPLARSHLGASSTKSAPRLKGQWRR